MNTVEKVILTVLLLLQCAIKNCSSDTFASTLELRQLFNSERRLLEGIDEYVRNEEERISKLRELVEEKKKNMYSFQIKDPAQYIGHPINAYKLIKHWHSLASLIQNHKSFTNLQVRLAETKTPLVAENDINGALLAILRLQRTYNVSTESFSSGEVYGHIASQLDHTDFHKLGMAASRSGDYGLAIEWLELALTDKNSTVYKPDILLELAQIHYNMGDYEEAAKCAAQVERLQSELQEDPYNVTTSFRIQQMKERNATWYREYRDQPPPPPVNSTTWQRILPFWKSNYEILCRDGKKVLSTLVQNPDMICRIRNPQNYYAWSKEEVFNWDPYVAVIHDVINDNEAQKMKDLAAPELMRAKVGDPSKAFESDERVSKVAWLWDQTSIDRFIPTLSNRVSWITGLDTKYRDVFSSSEPFQVLNYGMGGQYEPHVDFYEGMDLDKLPPYLLGTGDRLSTFMVYLSNVEAGGGTVFTNLNISVPPVKNGALFWYNIKRSGELDHRTQHAGCPVLIGEKWVANKWIREYGQEFRRPCGTSPSSVGTD